VPGAEPAPTRLQLKRQIQQLTQRLQAEVAAGIQFEVDWESLTDSGEPLRALEHLLRDSTDALAAISTEELGKSELAHLERVRLVDGPSAEVTREGGLLVITANLKAGPAGRQTPERLRAAIEKVL
jgi:hypothetical protein